MNKRLKNLSFQLLRNLALVHGLYLGFTIILVCSMSFYCRGQIYDGLVSPQFFEESTPTYGSSNISPNYQQFHHNKYSETGITNIKKYAVHDNKKELIEELGFNAKGFLIKQNQYKYEDDGHIDTFCSEYNYFNNGLNIVAKIKNNNTLNVTKYFYFNQELLLDSLVIKSYTGSRLANHIIYISNYDSLNRIIRTKVYGRDDEKRAQQLESYT